ncbi:uncharacterized protein K441DRAFT_668946 [Cenococcum geophilum 1.58]|uniref:uncharacterized protein n=1 Tax=Cenococcum geophilum 1.58 TaxID=794803 RepID=UPI00358EC218|nr:hypothetical protein K441DRAFT_668946 [Cenococcum geophilum 1.58]
MGVRMGLVLTFIGAAMLIGSPIQGWLMSIGGNLTVHNPTPFYWAQVFAGSAVMSGSACFVLGRLMLVDFRGVWI